MTHAKRLELATREIDNAVDNCVNEIMYGETDLAKMVTEYENRRNELLAKYSITYEEYLANTRHQPIA